jgi:hypothetical protein
LNGQSTTILLFDQEKLYFSNEIIKRKKYRKSKSLFSVLKKRLFECSNSLLLDEEDLNTSNSQKNK